MYSFRSKLWVPVLSVMLLVSVAFAGANDYKSDSLKYSITKPDDPTIWEFAPKNPQNSNDCTILKKRTPDDQTWMQIGIRAGNPGNDKPGDVAKNVDADIRKNMKDIKKGKSGNIKFAGCAAIDLQYTGMEPNGSVLYLRYIIFEAKNGLLYIISIQGLKGTEETYKKEIKKTLSSFRWYK